MSNYDRMQESARQLFLSYDLEKMARRLALPLTAEGLPIRFFGEEHFVRRADGEVLGPDGAKASHLAALSIYDVLTRTEYTPHLAGTFVPTMELHHIMGSNSVHEDLNQRDALVFSGRMGELEKACRALGGELGGRGDLCCRFPAFDFFPVELRFWEADEEFPAQLQYFWDANALDFLHYETLWYVMSELMVRLRREMGE